MTDFSVKTRSRPDNIDRVIREAAKKVADMAPAYKKASILLDQWVQRNFKTEGGNVGGWTPFAHGGRYIPGKGIDPTAKLLQHTGMLRASFKPWHTKTNAGIGSDLPYSKPHQEGTRTLPQRRMLPEREEVSDGLEDVFEQHIKDATRKLRG